MSQKQTQTPLAKLAADLVKAITATQAKADQLQAEIDQLNKAGITNAQLHMRDGKYAYWIHPQRDGARRRQYIGADPHKIQAAHNTIQRTQRHTQLSKQHAALTHALRETEFDLTHTLRRLHTRTQ